MILSLSNLFKAFLGPQTLSKFFILLKLLNFQNLIPSIPEDIKILLSSSNKMEYITFE